MAEETKQIDAIIGPYAGRRLTVTAADADQAINDHWAVDPFRDRTDEPHPPLDESERVAAVTAAQAWAAAQWQAAQGNPGGQTRAMAASAPATYTTRSTK